MKIAGLLLLSMLLLCTTVNAKEKTYGNFTSIAFVDNYDGDTITVNINGIPALFGKNISVRVYGIDTPEMDGECEKEVELAHDAKKYVHELLLNSYVDLLNVRRDKYFRILADVQTSEGSLAKLLLDNGYAIKYDGGTKTKNWCE
ncbi:thermonuclease family protein [bacterium]|nr:thermonuclease family protein [bacterium]